MDTAVSQSSAGNSANSKQSTFDLEPNPFEQSFASGGNNRNGSENKPTTTPGGTQSIATPGGRRHVLPPVASITSPSSLLPNPTTPGTQSWANSLRSGPLSPAMLQGPQNNPALLQQQQQQQQQMNTNTTNNTTTSTANGATIATSNNTNNNNNLSMFMSGFRRSGITPGGSGSMFPTPGPATAAILGLNPGPSTTTTAGATSGIPTTTAGNEQPDANNNSKKRNNNNPANGSNKSKKQIKPTSDSNYNTSVEPDDDQHDSSFNDDIKQESDDNDDSNEQQMINDTSSSTTTTNKRGKKKQSEEEKRKSFLERNRIAALKCRQRKKQQQANLEAKVNYLSTENESLNNQVTQLRDQLASVRSLLLSHKDSIPQELLAVALTEQQQQQMYSQQQQQIPVPVLENSSNNAPPVNMAQGPPHPEAHNNTQTYQQPPVWPIQQ